MKGYLFTGFYGIFSFIRNTTFGAGGDGPVYNLVQNRIQYKRATLVVHGNQLVL